MKLRERSMILGIGVFPFPVLVANEGWAFVVPGCEYCWEGGQPKPGDWFRRSPDSLESIDLFGLGSCIYDHDATWFIEPSGMAHLKAWKPRSRFHFCPMQPAIFRPLSCHVCPRSCWNKCQRCGTSPPKQRTTEWRFSHAFFVGWHLQEYVPSS